jgi:tRNA pseudouridine55 synthase
MNGVFAINKPSGITSAQFLARIQQIFTSSSVFAGDLAQLRGAKVEQLQREGQKASRRKLRKVMKVKMGHGGTLDPLASGVLVVGVGKGTKRLQDYLNGSVKVYETEALFGASTTTGDVEGELLTRAGTKHLTKEQLDALPEMFIGHTKQTPPIFAALKMNGKPLYEYAREGLPLPRAIEPRQVQIYELDIFDDSLTLNHSYDFIKSVLVEGERIEEKLASNQTLNDSRVYLSKEYSEKNGLQEEFEVGKLQEVTEAERSDNFKAPLLHLKTKVSSGTYIRSLISDIGRVLKTNAYMVKLVRAQQAEWELGKNVFNMEDFERDEAVWGKVLSQVFQKGGREIDDISSLFTQAEVEIPAVKENSNTAGGQPGHNGDQTKSSQAQQQQKESQQKDISSSMEQAKKRPLEE